MIISACPPPSTLANGWIDPHSDYRHAGFPYYHFIGPNIKLSACQFGGGANQSTPCSTARNQGAAVPRRQGCGFGGFGRIRIMSNHTQIRKL